MCMLWANLKIQVFHEMLESKFTVKIFIEMLNLNLAINEMMLFLPIIRYVIVQAMLWKSTLLSVFPKETVFDEQIFIFNIQL